MNIGINLPVVVIVMISLYELLILPDGVVRTEITTGSNDRNAGRLRMAKAT